MADNEFKEIIKNFKENLENRKNGQIRITYRKFLEKFGMKNRRSIKIRSISNRMKRQSIAFSFKEGCTLYNLPLDEYITFGLMKNESTEHKSMNKKLPNEYAGTIEVAEGKNPREPYKHQAEAIMALNREVVESRKTRFAGLLVLPTGGGKTLTAAQWLMKNYIDQKRKVLWIAHRHALLDQARESFQNNAYSNILKNRKSFNYRIVSGIHDKPVHIQVTDDLLIASKDSLVSETGLNYLIKNWIKNNEHLLLVIDEAHHSVARSYRKLIGKIRENVENFHMIGLTATPSRTAEKEQGLLKKLFTDDIIYKIDLRTLIDRGILSEPHFESPKTNVDMIELLTDEDLKKLQKFGDIESIGESTAKSIAENKKRNNFIVEHYIRNKKKYGQTLVFAINIDNAIALNAIFKAKGIASEFVVSTIHDAATGINISPKENKKILKRFENCDINVLINVNILTEGTDLPKVQTVFLARPTISSILMTQMIGRGLRGELAGGTKEAYIVSFIDNWQDKINWVNPEKLFIEENIDFYDRTVETKKRLLRLVSIEKMEEFAKMLDSTVDTKDLEKIDFIRRIPVGLYCFPILPQSENGEDEKSCEVLVYDNIRESYSDFINDLPEFFKLSGISEKEILNEEEIDRLSLRVENEYFWGCEKLPAYRIEDVKDILCFYARTEEKPPFIEFSERKQFDISKIAREIYEKRLGGTDKKDYQDQIWENEKISWKAFFGYNKEYFIRALSIELEKLENPELFAKPSALPKNNKELRELEKLSLSELREKNPEHERKLRDTVFDRAKDEKGYYTCAKTGFKSKSKIYFHIDHIKPMSKGGLTVLENLQLLSRKENWKKGNKIEK
jgi:superfamily II DNA or RNA helicase